MSRYRVAVNLEWTSKCNAKCVMCPREAIQNPQLMQPPVFKEVLRRITPKDVFRVVIAGYGEPTTHPRFKDYLEMLKGHPVNFDMVTNGQQLDEARLKALDGVFGMIVISFSSIAPEVYRRVHVGLDHERVKKNILLAQKTLRKTRLAISLTPMVECLKTLPETIDWMHNHGVTGLTMSPTFYDRAGSLEDTGPEYRELRRIIAEYKLLSQELDFIPGVRDLAGQWFANDFKCLPRNVDLPIAADGSYQYCFNDPSHIHPVGHVGNMSIREALEAREKMPMDAEVCGSCSMLGRYKAKEVTQVALHYFKTRLAAH